MSEFRDMNPERSFEEEDSNSIPAGVGTPASLKVVSRATSTEKMLPESPQIHEARLPPPSREVDEFEKLRILDTYGSGVKEGSGEKAVASSNYYDELLKQLEANPLPMNVPQLPKAINNKSSSDSNSSNKANGGAVDYSLVFGATNSNPLFGCYNFVLPTSDAELAAANLDQYLDTTEGISYEFTYYDCSWTVVHIENLLYSLYYIRLFQECLSDGGIKYHIYIKRVNGDHFNSLNFFENIRSLFYETEESPAKSNADAPANMDNILKGLLDLEEENNATLEIRANKAFALLKNNDETKNKEIVKYEKSEVIKTIVELSANEQARQYFTSDDLLALLQYLISINSNYDLTLAATRCVIIFYNVSLTEKLSQVIIDQLLDHLLDLASNDGNVYDKELRKKAAQTIENIVKTCDISSAEKKSKLYGWLEYTNLLRDKTLMQMKLKPPVRKAQMMASGPVDPMILQRTISGCH